MEMNMGGNATRGIWRRPDGAEFVVSLRIGPGPAMKSRYVRIRIGFVLASSICLISIDDDVGNGRGPVRRKYLAGKYQAIP